MDTTASVPRINIKRLAEDLDTMASLTEPERPYTRRAFTDVYLEGRRWLAARMRDAGLKVFIDAGGNLIGRLEGKDDSLAPIMIGSHTDTVVNGGRFDGVVGVLGALEALRVLTEAGYRLRHPVEVVDFLAEEPSDYGASCVGSLALIGRLGPEMLAQTNSAGETLAEGIRRMGGDPDALSSPLRHHGDIAAYLEMHIEQGPILERQGVPIGIVTAIASMEWHRIVLEGRADHAGTTPMEVRRDTLVAAADIILAVDQICRNVARHEYFVGTVGYIRNEPNNINVVSARTELTLDLRCLRRERTAEVWQILYREINRICNDRGVEWNSRLIDRVEGAEADATIVQVIEESAAELGYQTMRLPSGAGHDAMHVAKIAPMGMIFIPCREGRSHCPDEWTSLEDISRGVAVLARTLQHLDGRLE